MRNKLATAFIGLSLLCAAVQAQVYDWLSFNPPSLTNTAQTIKSGPGTLLWIACYNPNATTVWVQFYDLASAVTVGTTANTLSWPIGPGQSSGFFQPYVGRSYGATKGMQAAATTTSGGGSAPSLPLSCEFAYR